MMIGAKNRVVSIKNKIVQPYSSYHSE